MAKTVDEILTSLEGAWDGAELRDAEDVTNFRAQLAKLQAIIDGGGTLTDAQQARFDALQAKIEAHDLVNPNEPVNP